MLSLFILVIFFSASFCQAQDSVDIQELVVLTGEDVTTDETLGPSYGNIHPFISIQGEYTDNLYNINIDEQTNFLTTVSANIWIITPKAERLPIRLSSYNTAVGGSRFSLPSSTSFDRFQAYLLGGIDYNNFSMDSDLNYTPWALEGMLQYNLPSGLSFRIMDKFVDDRDRIEIGSFTTQDFTLEQDGLNVTSIPSNIRDFISNQARAFINIDMSEKISGYFDYTNYYLNYDREEDDWLDRSDNVFALSLFYHHSPGTSFFAELDHAIIDYDTATYNDNKESSLLGGIKWKGSIKTSLMFKGGYQVKEFDDEEREELESFTFETWLTYLVTDKTKMTFKLLKALEETDTRVSRGKDTVSGRFDYDQEFSERFRGYIRFRFEHYDYEKFDQLDTNQIFIEAREDWFYGIKPALQYDFNDWLMSELSYSFEERDSNYDLFDFKTQIVFLSLNAAFNL